MNVLGKSVTRVGQTFLLLLSTLAAAGGAHADTVTVAVASNFAETARGLAREFEEQSGYDVVIIQGSTGKLHAQIVNGAPFDVFLSADVERAENLPAAKDGRFIYAIGQLVVWSPDPELSGHECVAALSETDSGRIAIANPALAPYGLAAKEYLEAAGLWETLMPRLVYAQNVAQVRQFVATGNARFGFVAASQLHDERPLGPTIGCESIVWMRIEGWLEQQAVLLERATDNRAARGFFEYLNSDEARAQIHARTNFDTLRI